MSRPSLWQRFSTLAGLRGDRLVLSLAATGGVVIPFALAPIWSRVYPVEYFAISAMAQVLPGLAATWSTLAYQGAIQTPSDDEEALTLTILAISLAGTLGVVALGVVWVAGHWVAGSVLQQPAVEGWLWVAGPQLAASATIVTVDQWLIRRGQLRRLAMMMLATTLFAPIVPALGLLAPDRTNYILLGVLVGTCAGGLLRLIVSGVIPQWETLDRKWARLRETARRYWRFPRDIVPGNLLTNLSAQLPQMMLARHFATQTVGQYARGAQLLALPISVLGRPATAEFLKDGGQAYRASGDCRPQMRRILGQLSLSFLPIYFVIGLAAPWVYPWFFGPEWKEAGRLAQPLAVAQMAAGIGSPLGGILAISHRTHWDLAWQLFRISVIFVALFVGVRTGSAVQALWCFAAGNLVVYAGYVWLSWRAGSRPAEPGAR